MLLNKFLKERQKVQDLERRLGRLSPSQRNVYLYLLALFAGSSLGATDHFVSGAGDDANSGLTIAEPWATLDRVNAALLSPGDRVLFA
jgi:hypothetical protein